jgi:Tol biopolymer transport system component
VSGEILDRPSWSPDGRQLVYAAAGSNAQAGLWVISADGGVAAAIPGVVGRCPAWSPSADLIAYFTSGEASGLQIRFTTSRGEPRLEHLQVAPPPGAVDATAFSWDGRRLAVGSSPVVGEARIGVVDLDRGSIGIVARLGPFTGLRGIAWSADDARLVYGLVQHQSRVLLFDGIGR